MKAGLLITGSGTLVYLTSHKKFMDDALIGIRDRPEYHLSAAQQLGFSFLHNDSFKAITP